MIALSMTEDAPSVIYGAVTMGTLWAFGLLEVEQQLVTQNIGSLKLPDDLEDLMQVRKGDRKPNRDRPTTISSTD